MTGEEVASPLRVLVVGPESSSSRVLETGLGRDPRFEVVERVSDGRQVLGLLAERAVDLVLLDWDGTDLGATALLKSLQHSDWGGRAVVMTAYRSEAVLQGAVEAGAVAFVDKGQGWSARLGDQFLRAAEGQVVLSDWPGDLLEALLRKGRGQQKGDTPLSGEGTSPGDRGAPEGAGLDDGSTATGIPSRLVPVYQGILDGLTNRMIASRTGLSENTVRIYVSELLTLLGCQSRTEVVIHGLGTYGP